MVMASDPARAEDSLLSVERAGRGADVARRADRDVEAPVRAEGQPGMLPGHSGIADHDVARAHHHLWHELAETIRLAAPMALTQLSQIAMMTTDLAFIGRLGGEAVAAAALAGTVYWVSFTFGMGLMSAVAPLAAHAYGAGEVCLVRRSLRAGLWTALVVSLPIMVWPRLPRRRS